MNHFPLPERAEHIRVPNTTFKDYGRSNGGFLNFPAQNGWSKEDLMGKGKFGGRAEEEVQAFFQTWLYFGCAIEVFGAAGVEVSTADFLDSTKKFVSTIRLPEKIREWGRRVKMMDHSGLGSTTDCRVTIESILGEVFRLISHYCAALRRSPPDVEIDNSSQTYWPMSADISMSIIVLGHTLTEAMFAIFNFGQVYRKSKWQFSCLKTRMLQAGWCPMDIRGTLTDMDIDGHYYIAALPCPQGTQRHSICTEDACLAKGIDENTYVTRHREESCACGHVPIDLSCVVEILDGGGTPVVAWSDVESKLHVVEVNEGKGMSLQYIALSHVWSDGMGNPTKNSLPRCQLSYLQRRVDDLVKTAKSLDSPLYFWMDTLCVPVHVDLKKYRKLCIRRMEHIYKSAAAVLVLDSGIEKLHSTASEYERSLSIYFSEWNHRLWTFQEGLLAKDLFLQFNDKAISYRNDDMSFEREAQESISQGHCVTFPSKACSASMGQLVILLYYMLNERLYSSIAQALPPMVQTIQHRTTTRLSDQTLCACAILGLDPKELLDAPGEGVELEERRMEIFLSMVGSFPPDIIFNQCIRLQREGFRWAPKSFLGAPKDGYLKRDDGDYAVLTERGLSLKSPGLTILGSAGQKVQTILAARVQNGHQRFEISIRLKKGQPEPRWDVGARYAVVLKASFKMNSEKKGELLLFSSDAVVGVIRESYEGEGVQLRHEFLATVEALDVEADAHAEDKPDCRSESTLESAKDNESPPILCELLDDKTQWFLL